MEPVVTMREPRDLIALVPFQLGFEPEASAVVISLRGPRSRVGLVARVDLADLSDPDHGAQVARDLVGHLAGDGATQVVAVLYPDVADAAADTRIATPLAHLRAAGEHLFGPIEAWVVGADGWWSEGCRDRACCPEGGRPLAELSSAPIRARMVYEGVGVAPRRAAVAEVLPAGRPARKSARGARARWLARAQAATGPEAAYRWRRASLAAWTTELGRELAGGPGPTGPATAGRLEAALDDVLVRDAVLLSFVPGSERPQDLVLAGVDSEEVGTTLREIVDPSRGRAPDLERVRAATAVLSSVVAHAPRDRQAPAQTLLAVLAWWCGDGARANLWVDQALRGRPTYRLALLVRDALAGGMPPGWISRDRRAAG